jgi:uncharacterized protein (TIGR02118 family)
MQCATVVYPNQPGAKFDFDYYLKKHVPAVAEFFGTSIDVQKGTLSPMGPSLAFICIARIWINSLEHFQTTMEQHGSWILGDVANYTNIQPIVQIDEVVRSR